MIVWDESILVGIPKVDSDHKDILAHINQFIADIETQSSSLTIHDSFRRMEQRIYRHLDAEEKMIEALSYVGSVAHKAAHVILTDDLEQIWDEMLESPDFKPDDAARKWLEDWLFNHVRNEDFKYRDWIFGAGLEDQAERLMLNHDKHS